MALYRQARYSDIPAMARIRAHEWETEAYWDARIAGYMDGQIRPQHALKPRAVYVALEEDALAGFIAGHLTRRLQCDGELEWINVAKDYRGRGIARELLRRLAEWFVEQKALRVCVDPDEAARSFYTRHGAVRLNPHWLVWNDIRVMLAERNADHS